MLDAPSYACPTALVRFSPHDSVRSRIVLNKVSLVVFSNLDNPTKLSCTSFEVRHWDEYRCFSSNTGWVDEGFNGSNTCCSAEGISISWPRLLGSRPPISGWRNDSWYAQESSEFVPQTLQSIQVDLFKADVFLNRWIFVQRILLNVCWFCVPYAFRQSKYRSIHENSRGHCLNN